MQIFFEKMLDNFILYWLSSFVYTPLTYHFRECSRKNFPKKKKTDSREKEHFLFNPIGLPSSYNHSF
jgi:hypothetical protein